MHSLIHLYHLAPALALVVGLLPPSLRAASEPPRPNILFIFADDWGFGDLGCHGNDVIETPNLDALAGRGTDFHQFTVASGVCSPSRTALLTGHFPARYRINRHFASVRHHVSTGMPDWLDPTAPMLPRLLQQAGYRTYHFGKWHLTNYHVPDAPHPVAYGYDKSAIWGGSEHSAQPHEVFDLAIGAIKEAGDQPFFINLWLHETHTPHYPTKEMLEHYAAKGLDERERVYPAVVTNADRQIGRVLKALDEAGLAEDTLVVFSSDNGPEYPLEKRKKMDHPELGPGLTTWYSLGSSGGLKGRKRSLHEGGVRVPLIVRWPGKVKAGHVDKTSVISGVDWLPTLCAIAGADLPEGYVGDGEDRSMVLLGRPVERGRAIYWFWPGGHGGEDGNNWPLAAIRDGKWKLLISKDRRRVELYDIPADRAEAHNLADEQPEVVGKLRRQVEAWLAELPDEPDPACLSKLRTPSPAAPTPSVAPAAPSLEEIFHDPPMAARPSGYWWWLYSNVDKATITRDLEEFRDKGMGAVLLVCSSNWSGGSLPNGPAFLSDDWNALFKHALQEAHRLDLKVDVNIAPGWNMGGPWITPENACRWYLQSELTVEGPKTLMDKLPLPGVNDGYNDQPQLGVRRQMQVPMEEADYRDTAVVAFQVPQAADVELKNPRPDLAAKSARSDDNCFVPAEKLMAKPRQPWNPSPQDVSIDPSAVVDLTAKLEADGTLDWEVPPGKWVIVRTGHRMTGAMLSVPIPGQEGLENDFLGRAGVEQMFKHSGRKLAELAGPLAGTTLRAFCSDSFEAGYPNWTAEMPKLFKTYRGYDMLPYLPVLKGYIVGNAERSERFLHDYRKTIADCMADEHYGRFAELSAEHGILVRAEPGGPNWSSTLCMDGLKNLGRTHFPQGEFWRKIFVEDGQNMVGKQTATAAHIYGIRTASAEALTSAGSDPEGRSIHWSAYPEIMKPLVDRAFCEGINNMVFHTMTAQKPQDGKPGFEYGAGTHFNPNVTWWDQTAKPWLDYINRCQALLQRGLFVADVLYYNGDWAPNMVKPKHVDPSLGKGYDYDVCNEEVLLTRLSVRDGRIVLPDGMSYRLLVLPDETRMPAAVAEKIAELVGAGATVVGPRPTSDPGLRNYPECDDTVKSVADELWGDIDGSKVVENRFGKGRVIEGRSLLEILTSEGAPPDLEVRGNPDAFIDFIHRRDDDADWYFLCNRNDREEAVTLHFRQTGRQPELWDPLTGAQRPLPEYEIEEGITRLAANFGPHESVFIVFRREASERDGRNVATDEPEQSIEGPWKVRFDPEWFYPVDGLQGNEARGEVVFEQLQDWSQRPEPAVKYFSGTARYQVEFELKGKPEPGTAHFLELGKAGVSARVSLNGTNLGVAWCHPWRVQVGAALREGRNKLEIEVVNCWQNRLIGDGLLPEDQRRTRTNVKHFYLQERRGKKLHHPLMPSGLRGPVTLVRRVD